MTELILRKGVKRTRVLLHDDIDQLPIEQFNKVNKMWILNDDLGNSFEDIDRIHLSRLYLSLDNKEKVKKEIDNLRILIYNIINELNPLDLSFVALIHSIDSQEITDFSDENLKLIIQRLSKAGLTADILKKKVKR